VFGWLTLALLGAVTFLPSLSEPVRVALRVFLASERNVSSPSRSG
jgi:hypothetical protein